MNLNLNVECNGVYSWHMLLKSIQYFGQLSLLYIVGGNLIIVYCCGQLSLLPIVWGNSNYRLML